MFDFTSEAVLNSLSRVSVVTSSTEPTFASGEKALYVKRLNKFRKAGVLSIFKSAGYAPVNEVGQVAVPASMSGLGGKVLRLSVDATLSGSQDAEYTRWAVNKGKPFYVEYLVGSADPANTDALGAALATSFNAALKKAGHSDIVVTYNATSDKLEITATNEYQRFQSILLEKYNTTTDEFDVIGTGDIKTAGKEGFGTSWYLTKNFRLPTIENIRFMGEHLDERPVEGVIYDQYTIRYQADRNFTGQGAVGQKIQSVTTHVFYIPNTLSSTFESYISDAYGTSALINATTGNPIAFSALADIVFAYSTVSAATSAANGYVGSLTSYLADLSEATGVTYSLVSGTGSTDNAAYKIVDNEVRTVGTVTAGSKSIRVQVADGNSTYAEIVTFTVAS